MEQWVTMIQDLGFPILVSFYLLYRIESKLEAIHDVLLSMKLNL
ncbi:YvrJ family protein [Metasolibacillus meyeri]|uniref:YvrJ family protein n=1 Tax=Metasolibacillus meyeri TaxID=1071052 RepID=A0AAW9NSE9_9BACL|nr:YvrJ family protein [Metasolibacillus meyeri]MEC1177340.1 YvrJ family protein [Metasolibacillus meyeri]